MPPEFPATIKEITLLHDHLALLYTQAENWQDVKEYCFKHAEFKPPIFNDLQEPQRRFNDARNCTLYVRQGNALKLGPEPGDALQPVGAICPHLYCAQCHSVL